MTKAKKNIGDASTCKNKCQLCSIASIKQKALTAECTENAEAFRASALNTIEVQNENAANEREQREFTRIIPLLEK